MPAEHGIVTMHTDEPVCVEPDIRLDIYGCPLLPKCFGRFDIYEGESHLGQGKVRARSEEAVEMTGNYDGEQLIGYAMMERRR